MSDRVDRHVTAFNDAVRTGNWSAFLAGFAPDAVMTFDGVPVGPYVGIDEISRAYAERPPTDTMTVIETSPSGDVDVVRFAWDAGGTGTLRISWRDGAVSALAITFNES